MTYVVTNNCISCKHTNCVDICPADAFHEGKNFLAINPEECVDCGLCVPECPEEAIVPESELDNSNIHFLVLNEKLSQQWPAIMESITPLSEHAEWSGVEDKLEYLVR